MKESGKERLILTKAYEIAYALFRLAAPMKEEDFAEKLRTSAAALLEAASAENYPAAGRAVQVIECLVKFAGDVNLVGMANTDIILREIYALSAAIAERRQFVRADEIDVSEIFSKPAIAEPKPANRQSAIKESAMDGSAAYESIKDNPAINPVQINEEESAIGNSANRQSAILEKIRQTGNCRLKDIQDLLPGTSERTIRYDIQTLLGRDLIERVGSNGPSVFYRIAG